MPKTTLLDIPPAEQAQMLAALRRARYGSLLALHVLLLWTAGHTPTEIATVLCCSRSSVYRIIRLYHAEQLGCTVGGDGPLTAPIRTTVLRPWITRARRSPQGPSAGLWLVSHPLELCHLGTRTPRQTSP